MAGLMRANFRFHDQIYRFGGEEFVVLMRCADHADAAAALERYRQKVQAHNFPQVGPTTVSVGFSALRSDDTPSSAFDRADKAVYYAKAHGRNQVCSYAELSAMEQRYNIAEKLVSKQSYTSIMGNIGASSAIISRVSRVISREDSVLRRLLEEKAEAPTEE